MPDLSTWAAAYLLMAAYFFASAMVEQRTAPRAGSPAFVAALTIYGLLWLPFHLYMLDKAPIGLSEYLRRKFIPAVGAFVGVAFLTAALGNG